MAVDYEQYRQAADAEKSSMVNIAQGRLEANLRMSPQLPVDLPRFFRDVYLLSRVDFFNTNPQLLAETRKMAGHPKVRGEFVNTLKAQDAAGESEEVLASIHVGELFEYHKDKNGRDEPRFKEGFDQLTADHKKLIEQAEKQRKAEEAAKQKAEEEAKWKASTIWPPEESNAGKFPEWVQAWERIAQLWEVKSQSLPKGREKAVLGRVAVDRYVAAGFDLLKEEILNGSAKTPLAVRAMLEYLMRRILEEPRQVNEFFLKQAGIKTNPTNLSEANRIGKILFIPQAIQNLKVPTDDAQKKQIRQIFKIYQKALHPDLGNSPDAQKDIQPMMDVFHKAVNTARREVIHLV